MAKRNTYCERKSARIYIYLETTAVLLCLLFAQSLFGKEKESFYDQLSRAVVRLEHIEIIQNKQAAPKARIQHATGFFVGSGNDLYIVSARHVVEKAYDLRARVQLVNLKTGKMAPFLLELPCGDWVYHPINGDKDTHCVDVAARKIPFNEPNVPRCFVYKPADPSMKKGNQLPSTDATPPRTHSRFWISFPNRFRAC